MKNAPVRKNKIKIIAPPGKQELFILREFDAPRELVFKAHIDAKLYPQWIGSREFTSITLESFDAQTGGSWRYILQDKDKKKYAFHGVYHEVKPPERIVGTFEFEGWSKKGHVELDSAIFEELPRKRTLLTVHAIYQTVADRDAMLEADMEKGASEGYDQLDTLLVKMMKK